MSLPFLLAVPTGVAGLALVVLAVGVIRRWDVSGGIAFAIFLGLLGLGGLGTMVLAQTATVIDTTTWLAICTEFAALAWLVFTLRYTGRGYMLSSRLGRLVGGVYIGLLLVPFLLQQLNTATGVTRIHTISAYLVGLVATLVGATLLLETIYRHGYLQLRGGLALGFLAIEPWFLTMVGFAGAETLDPSVLYALYAGGYLGCLLVVAGVLFGLDVLDVTAATQTVGRRAVMGETPDIVFVVDEDDCLVELNDAAAEKLGIGGEKAYGDALGETLELSIDDIRGADSVELRTVSGLRQFDAEVIRLTDARDNSLGSLVSLRDITERRQREQGLDVLNRLLRHNLRNELTVTKGYTDVVMSELDDPELTDSLSTALDSVDSLLRLAEKARATQRALTHDEADLDTVDISWFVAEVAEEVSADLSGEITVEGDGGELRVDHSLLELAVRNVLENALEHSTAESPRARVEIDELDGGVRIRVDDNGPGIPPAEVEAVRAGRETPTEHASSIGLWLIEWSIASCGGTVEFGDGPDGGRVDIWLPRRDEEPSAH